MFTTTYVAAVREELPCEYEARNMKDMLQLCCRNFCFRISWGNHDGELLLLTVVRSHLFVKCSLP